MTSSHHSPAQFAAQMSHETNPCCFCLSPLNDTLDTNQYLPCLCVAHSHCYNQVFYNSSTLSLTQGVITCGNCVSEMTIDASAVVHLVGPRDLVPILRKLCNLTHTHACIKWFLDGTLDIVTKHDDLRHAEWSQTEKHSTNDFVPLNFSSLHAPSTQDISTPPSKRARRIMPQFIQLSPPVEQSQGSRPPKGNLI